MQITVALPEKIKTGKSVSNLEIMEKLSAELKPDKFLVLKVSVHREKISNITPNSVLDLGLQKHCRLYPLRGGAGGTQTFAIGHTASRRCLTASVRLQ